MNQRFRFIPAISIAVFVTAVTSFAQSLPVRDRIVRPIERYSSVQKTGNVHPFTRTSADNGEAPGSLEMNRITMVFQQTAAQQADLATLLAEQQDATSANYHRWLTPEQFADRFGLSANDVSQVTAWLQSQGFTVNEVARSRQWVTFSGTARTVEATFQTRIHQFARDGKNYYANVTEPSVPPEMQDIVMGFRALNNFRLRARQKFTSNVSGSHFVTPNDFTTIYDLAGLYAEGLNGSGQTIAIMGQTDIALSDIATFRSLSGLPALVPEVILVPGSTDPGTSQDDLPEADLDIEWSGAVAPQAKIIFVNSGNGAFDSMQYSVDENLAPVISISYGNCEAAFGRQEVNAVAAIAEQANAQGITITSAAGDDGAADCDSGKIATQGLAVDVPAAVPYVTGVGGTEFQEGSGNYWSATNNADNGSALSYIPETVWNDTVAEDQLDATGGGKSTFFTKPAWQTGTGVPNDGGRDVPDVAFNASDYHDSYLVCSGGSCVNGYRAADQTLFAVGGTSVGAPTFAGVVALINQSAASQQGNINPKLYQLAATSPAAFHDITSGSNQVPCQAKSVGCPSSGYIGYNAGVGYDQTTGLGSIDVGNLIAAWNPATSTEIPTISGISPSQGPTVGGSLLTITGTNFAYGSTVTIGGVAATVVSDTATSIQAVTPAGSAGTTSVIVVDPNGQSATASFTYSSAAVSQLQLTVNGNGSTYAESTGTAATDQVGYGVISPGTGVAVLRSFSGGQLVSEAAVPPTPAANQWTMYAEYDGPGTGVSTGVAIANPGASVANLTLTLSNGNQTTVQLAAGAQRASFVNEFFPDLGAFTGTMSVQSNTPVSIVALRGTTNSNGQFIISTIPATSGSSSTGGFYAFPIVTDGGGYTTDLILVNPGTSTSSGTINFSYSLATSQGTNSAFAFTIPAGGMWRLQTSGTPGTVTSGYASMSVTGSSPTPSATAIIRLRSGNNLISETAVPAQIQFSNGLMFGALEMNNGEYVLRTGIAMLNGYAENVQVTLTPMSSSGQPVGSPATITIPPYANVSKFLDEMIPTLALQSGGFQGTVLVQSSQPIWAISLRGSNSANGFLMSTTPVFNLSQAYSGTYYFPQIVDGGGYTTAFLSTNAGSANVSLQFYTSTGQPMALSLNN